MLIDLLLLLQHRKLHRGQSLPWLLYSVPFDLKITAILRSISFVATTFHQNKKILIEIFLKKHTKTKRKLIENQNKIMAT